MRFLPQILLAVALCSAAGVGAVLGRVSNSPSEQHTVNEVDVGFAQSMLVHHNQAIQMATLVQRSDDPAIAGLANSIIRNQLHEIGLLTGWLTAWGAPVGATGKPMAWVENAKGLKNIEDQLYAAQCKANNGAMAGMATPDQLHALAKATGPGQSRLFLELMIEHHKSAIPMANFAFRNGRSMLVKGLARTVAREQSTEIGWMQNQLAMNSFQP